jgi:AsmA protein
MKGLIKWGLILGGLFLVLVVGAVIIIPQFVDVQKYKPKIEELVTQQTGRSFSMGDDIQLSVFPWVGVSLADLNLGNPKGFGAREMVSIKRFEVRLKVMPLLSRRIEVDTFVVDTPRFFLEKTKEGKANWENLGPAKQVEGKKADQTKQDSEKQEKPVGASEGKLPIESLVVGNFSILNGFVSYVDNTIGLKKEVSDFNLILDDISLDKPIGVKLSATLDGKPLSLEGKAGPVGKEPGKEDIALDFTLKALEILNVQFKGNILKPMAAGKIAMDLDVAPFSPRKLFSQLGQDFPVITQDPRALDNVAMKAKIIASAQAVSISEGIVVLDDSKLSFLADAKAFDKPDLKFDLTLDIIDLDRYLPPSDATEEQKSEKIGSDKKSDQKKTDYEPLRKMVLDGKIKVGSLKAANISIQDFVAHVTAKNGVFDLDPLALKLYQGSVASKARLDVRKKNPKTSVTLDAKGIQAGPLLKDAIQKEMIEGTLDAAITLGMTGESPDMVKKTLNGKGELKFIDGAIVGIDIANTVRNAGSGLGLGEKTTEKPRTDFAELKIPFTADKGVVNIKDGGLVSPLLRIIANGKANLVKEDLDFRVEPKLVATLKGQGDTKDRSGLMVPLLITGPFTSPKIRVDLKSMIGGKLPDTETIKEMINTKDLTNLKDLSKIKDLTNTKDPSNTGGESIEDKAKGALKSLMPSLTN